MRFRPLVSWSRSSKVNTPSSTYSTQKRARSVPCSRFFFLCPVSLPTSRGECVCCHKFIIFRSALIHSVSKVSANAITINKNRTGDMKSACLTPTVWLIFYSIFPIFRTTFRSWYILEMADRSFGGAPYRSSIFNIMTWLTVSNAFTRSMNAT